MARIKTASGYKYKAHIKIGGKNVKIKTFTRQGDAQRWAKRIEADHEYMESLGCKGAGATLKELSIEYQKQWTGRDTNQPIRVKHWVDVLGHHKLVNITESMIESELLEIEAGYCKRGNGKGKTVLMSKTRSPAIVNRYISVLSAMMTYALTKKYIVVNPVSKIN